MKTYKAPLTGAQRRPTIQCQSVTEKTDRFRLDQTELEMRANAQRDGRPAEYVVPSVQRRKVWLTPTTTVPRRETR